MSDAPISLESRHEIERRFHDEQAAAGQPKTDDFYAHRRHATRVGGFCVDDHV